MSKSKTVFSAEIEWRHPDSLTPYANNVKKHPTSQIDKIAGAIAEFGFDQPIVVDEQGIILKGHGRREASLRLGLDRVPVIVRADLSEAQKKAARLADNRSAESGYDYEALSIELEDLDSLDFDLGLTGFDPAEIDKFLEDEGVEFQSSQVIGDGDDSDSDRSVLGEGEQEGEDDTAVSKSPQEKYPLAIVLSSAQKKMWEGFKVVLETKDDTKTLLKIMELGVRLNGE
ncbi:ParB N-terminal domain-containing protein [Oculatella sp. LEGE 06141]|uniref:ParB/Srx family N-terminal domain-containing protein n=1 Tax=Oculatella sp. LEGE 06141 TaxID=1828648 RepID=UPI00187DEC9D|nr:ParB/Srx family N-terminal domain-containing protein [Oculatella sp. LEGE 06141]MBE9178696.1 ParB N-terminal domain-containing protein [Oculatella sp. LEGE 06141]